jgi:hypothetical protein
MKKALLLAACAASFTFTNPCVAQYTAFKLDGFGALQGRLGLSAERSFGRHFSALLTFESARYATGERNQQEVYKLSGYGFIPEVRYYPFTGNKPAPLGWFVGGAFRYASLKEAYAPAGVQLTGRVINAGLNAGYKFNHQQALIEVLTGYGAGQLSGLDPVRRQQIDPFFAGSTLAGMKDFFRFEISVGLVFPQVQPNKNGGEQY